MRTCADAVRLVMLQVFDYIVNAVKRTGPSIELRDDEDMAMREDFSSWEWLVLNVCEVGLACITDIEPAVWLGAYQQNEQTCVSENCSGFPSFPGSITLLYCLSSFSASICIPQAYRYIPPCLHKGANFHGTSPCRSQACWRSSWHGCTSLTQS